MKGSFLPTHSLPLAISFATFRMPKSNEWENKIKSSKNAHEASRKTMHTLTNCYIYQSFAFKMQTQGISGALSHLRQEKTAMP